MHESTHDAITQQQDRPYADGLTLPLSTYMEMPQPQQFPEDHAEFSKSTDWVEVNSDEGSGDIYADGLDNDINNNYHSTTSHTTGTVGSIGTTTIQSEVYVAENIG